MFENTHKSGSAIAEKVSVLVDWIAGKIGKDFSGTLPESEASAASHQTAMLCIVSTLSKLLGK